MARTIIPARAIIPFLVGMMLLTGVCNTLLTKYQVRRTPSFRPEMDGSLETPLTTSLQPPGQPMRAKLR